MDPTQTFQEFHTYLAVSAPLDLDAAIGEIEAFYPEIMKIVQKDVAFVQLASFADEMLFTTVHTNAEGVRQNFFTRFFRYNHDATTITNAFH